MAEHALLSASGASRWLACTPSARLEEQFPDSAGEAAREGTLAHELCELLLRNKLGRVSDKALADCIVNIKKDPLFFPEMLELCEEYAQYVFDEFTALQQTTPDAICEVEVKLDFSEWVPEGFGTGDAVIIANNKLRIIDFKFGKGVPVSCKENKQMMLYALGAMYLYKWMYSIELVEMTIYQPRLSNISSWEVEADRLEVWAEGFLKPQAALAYNGEGEFAPGDHCRFCKAKKRCRALASFNQKLETDYNCANLEILSDEEIADIMTRAGMYVAWVNSITDYAQDQAVNHGKVWPGFKLVEGRSVRCYTDKEAVADLLLLEGYSEEQIFEKSLLGITAMEKAITKKKFTELLCDLVIKPEGKPTLVPMDDKRPAINTAEKAAQAFADVDLTQ